MTVLRFLLLALLCPAVASAAPPTPAKARTTPPSGFRAEFLANLGEVEEKIVMLAQATPDTKYGWRPAADVRSTSEVFMHVVGGNYFLSTFIGAKSPVLPADMEKKITRKDDVIAELKKSFVHLRAAAGAVSDKDLERSVKLFGTQTTYRGVMITMLSHLHEHLGQGIAYSRMSGVVPPWSR